MEEWPSKHFINCKIHKKLKLQLENDHKIIQNMKHEYHECNKADTADDQILFGISRGLLKTCKFKFVPENNNSSVSYNKMKMHPSQ